MTPANAPRREQEVFYDPSSPDTLQTSEPFRPPRSFTTESVMTGIWALAALWLGLALLASLLSIWFRISTALSEIVVGTIAQLIIGAIIGHAVLGTDESWVKFLSGSVRSC
jgi:hypothetical protein